MPKLPATRRGQLLLVLFALLIAVVGGVIAGRNLFQGKAAVRTIRAQTASDKYGVLQAQATAHPTKRTVPFLGPFAHGRKGIKQCGPAVRIMEGALRNTVPPVRKAKAADCVGVATVRQLKVFQRRHHIPATGIYGPRTHKALSPIYTPKQRDALVYTAKLIVLRKERATALIALAHANLVGQNMAYSQSDRGYFPPWPAVQSSGDCSSFATWVMYEAGVGYRVGYLGPGSSIGWTGTLSRQGKHVGRNAPLHVGDLLFYGGGYPYGHVEVYLGHGLSEGHGSPGIHVHPYNYRPVSEIRRMIF